MPTPTRSSSRTNKSAAAAMDDGKDGEDVEVIGGEEDEYHEDR